MFLSILEDTACEHRLAHVGSGTTRRRVSAAVAASLLAVLAIFIAFEIRAAVAKEVRIGEPAETSCQPNQNGFTSLHLSRDMPEAGKNVRS